MIDKKYELSNPEEYVSKYKWLYESHMSRKEFIDLVEKLWQDEDEVGLVFLGNKLRAGKFTWLTDELIIDGSYRGFKAELAVEEYFRTNGTPFEYDSEYHDDIQLVNGFWDPKRAEKILANTNSCDLILGGHIRADIKSYQKVITHPADVFLENAVRFREDEISRKNLDILIVVDKANHAFFVDCDSRKCIKEILL